MADQIPPIPTKIDLTVVTRERKILEAEADEVVLPATDGEIGVLPGHTPLLAMLKVGQMRFRQGTTMERLIISWDRVIVLAERGFLPEEIDPARAEEQKREAEKEMAYLASHDPEFAIVEGRLEESIAMINIHR